MARHIEVQISVSPKGRLTLFACVLGLYWAWPTLAALQFLAPYESAGLIEETSRVLNMVACALATIGIGAFPSVACWLKGPAPLAASCATGAAASIVLAFGGFGTPWISWLFGTAMGFASAVLQYRLCLLINPASGSQRVVCLFAASFIAGALFYLAVAALGGLFGALGAIGAPLIVGAAISALASASPPSRGQVAPESSDNRASRKLPWQLLVGFTILGVAFGLSRLAPEAGAAALLSFDALHQVFSAIAGALLIIVALKARNLFWALAVIAVSCFAGTFVATYWIGSAGALTVVNALTTAGYSCFELLMWMIIYDIASETRTAFARIYGFGRGLMQLGVTIGAILLYASTATFGGDTHSALVQSAAFATVIALLGCFGSRRASDLWGMEKIAIGSAGSPSGTSPAAEDISSLLAEKMGLSPRECEVALLLMQGRSEPFIAESLFLSPSTVHTHVSHIYTKACVHSRQEFLSKVAEL